MSGRLKYPPCVGEPMFWCEKLNKVNHVLDQVYIYRAVHMDKYSVVILVLVRVRNRGLLAA